MEPTKIVDPKTDHNIDMVMLAILVQSPLCSS